MARLLILAFSSIVILVLQTADGKCPPWCVTRADAPMDRVQLALDWSCSNGADCSPIKPGGTCYNKDDIKAMASYAINDYFQRSRGLCNYGDVAALTNTDPSHGACKFSCAPF